MLLRSCSYHQELTLEQYYYLFKDLEKQTEGLEYSLEIIDAALDDRINYEKEEFNLMGYCHAIKKNSMLKKSSERSRVIPFTEPSDGENGITIESIASKNNDYEEFLDKEDVRYTTIKIKALADELLTYEGIDIVFTIRRALRGIPQAIDSLKEICTDYPNISEYLQILLTSGVSFEELFPVNKSERCADGKVK